MIGLVEPPRMVTKGNKMFAETAEIREVEGSRAKDRRAFIYLPQRGIEAVLGDGARYRVRTCDPYRVKVVLYH